MLESLTFGFRKKRKCTTGQCLILLILEVHYTSVLTSADKKFSEFSLEVLALSESIVLYLFSFRLCCQGKL